MYQANSYDRSSLYHLAEWGVCVGLHYSGLDRRLGPLLARHGGSGAILMYHRVRPDGSASGPFHRRHFAAQIEHLTRRYRVLPLDEMVDALARRRPLPPRAVAVTFDDGYRDNFTQAFPVLAALSCPATIFLTAGYIGTSHLMWWDQLSYLLRATSLPSPAVAKLLVEKHGLPESAAATGNAEALHLAIKGRPEADVEAVVDRIATDLGVDPAANEEDRLMSWSEAQAMVASGLITMGAHTVTHRNLKRLPLAEARREIVESKAIIERTLGRSVDLFAYPFGNPANDFTDDVKAAVRESGFRAAFSVTLGLVRPGDDLFALPRFCESTERWRAPGGGFSRALFDVYLSGARERLSGLKGSARMAFTS